MAPASTLVDRMPPSDVERELVERSIAGDGQAFARLVEPHLGIMYRIAARATRNPALAEDALQETLEILHRHLHRYTPGTSFRAFVAAIAVRRGRTLLRAELRRKRREEATMPGAGPPWPSDYVAAEEIAARVRAALARLPAKRQKIALLRLDAGLGYDEIANVVGTTEGSARVLVHHVLRDLRAELGDLLGKEALHGPSR